MHTKTVSETQSAPHVEINEDLGHAERARLLMQLIKRDTNAPELKSLRDKAATVQDEKKPDGALSAAEMRRGAAQILKRLERRAPPRTNNISQSKPPKTPPISVIRTTIAALVSDADLDQEHPAVVALVLQNQSRQTKTNALRAMDGARARRVQSALTALARKPS